MQSLSVRLFRCMFLFHFLTILFKIFKKRLVGNFTELIRFVQQFHLHCNWYVHVTDVKFISLQLSNNAHFFLRLSLLYFNKINLYNWVNNEVEVGAQWYFCIVYFEHEFDTVIMIWMQDGLCCVFIYCFWFHYYCCWWLSVKSNA